MKKKSFNVKHVFSMLLMVLPACQVMAQQDAIIIKLDKTTHIKIEPCTPQIFRIRVSLDGNFNQSLMERYEIIKTDWSAFAYKKENNNNFLSINTGEAVLILDKKNKTIAITDKSGKAIVEKIDFSLNKTKAQTDVFLQSLKGYFGKEDFTTNIIGDTAAENKKVSRDVVSTTKEVSLLSVGLNKTERMYGLGSAVRDRIQQRGGAARIWAQYQKSESPIPYLMSTDGWGIFYNTTKKHYFDIGRFDNDKLIVYGSDKEMDFYIMLGSMPQILDRFTSITGKPFTLPRYAYGLAFGSNTLENQFDVLNNAMRFRQEKFPLDIYWLEPQWMDKMYDFSTEKYWNRTNFRADWPEFKGWEKPTDVKKHLFVNKLKQHGFKVGLWLCVEEDLSIPEEMRIAAKQGKILPGKVDWFKHLATFINDGASGYKIDPGRTMDEHADRKYYNGLTDAEMHQVQQVLVAKNVQLVCKETNGERPFIHYCGGYTGVQQFTAMTSGDNGGGKKALFDQLNLGLSGHINTSCDVLEQVIPMEPGIHFGFLLPWTQVNSWAFVHHPWFMNAEEQAMFRFYDNLRYSLLPYIYSTALNGHFTGMPILRAMPLMYPNEKALENNFTQYMFGDNLLVAAFTNKVYLPAGTWIDYWTGKKYTGQQEIICDVPKDRGGPLFIKAGAIIPYQPAMQYTDQFPLDTINLKIYPENESSYTLYEDDGISFKYDEGAVASTKFVCKADKNTTELTIQPRQGSYDGMPVSRNYAVEVYTVKPSEISLNGLVLHANEWIYDDNLKMIKVLVKEDQDKMKALVLKIK